MIPVLDWNSVRIYTRKALILEARNDGEIGLEVAAGAVSPTDIAVDRFIERRGSSRLVEIDEAHLWLRFATAVNLFSDL